MVKAKEFWNFICNDLEYRFFAGMPTSEFVGLYDAMDPEIMHYIPASNSQVALNLCSGAYVSGFKSAAILPSNYLDSLDFSFILKNDLSALIITDSMIKISETTTSVFKSLKGLKTFTEKIEREKGIGILVSSGGALK
jgi:tRNA(Phe) wybutosine-synthesizing methylase Tyw3